MDKIIVEHLTVKLLRRHRITKRCLVKNSRTYSHRIVRPGRRRGKSTFLRVLNRLNDLADVQQVSGNALLREENGEYIDILDPKIDVIALRRKVGMVFARAIVLPFSIRGNLTYGLEMAGEQNRGRLDEAVERSLKQAALWEEVKNRLDEPAISLSGGQQQRLCIAAAWL